MRIGLFMTLLAAAAAPMWAHHSFAAEFDRTKVVRLEGVVTKMEWVNPHAMIHLAVRNADGTVTNWRIEGNTPNSLLRVGVTKKSLEVGTEILVTGYLSRSGENTASAGALKFKNGKQLSMGPDRGDGKTVLDWVSSDEELWRLQLQALRENNGEVTPR
jgi:hypothetical protein